MRKYLLFSSIILSTYLFNLNAQQLAFPGAEGYGRFTTGGRGGVVYEVTNLSDAGVGSLRYGIEMSGARTIVFKVSGTIEITKSLQIKNGNLTIAGQTAPGDGICIKAKKLVVPASAVTALTTISSYSVSVDADNVIIRFLRFRPGDEIDNSVGAPIANIKFENDGLTGRQHKNIIIDHCSMSWAIDEVSSFYDNTNFTMQWCLLGESLYHSFHPKGDHGYGGIWGGMGASFHHNLIADHTSRNPRFCGARYHCVFPQSGCAISLPASTEIVDFRNNVVFNWGGNSAYGGEGGQQNMINNYYKPGPATRKKGGSQLYRLIGPSVSTDPKVDSVSKWYLSGNYMEGYPAVTSNNAHGSGFQPDNADSVIGLWARVMAPFPFAPVRTQTAQEAYASILDSCGVFLRRDTVDERIVYEARTGTAITGGTFGTNTGIIDNPAQVGGWPTLHSTAAPTDTDHDGMPDDWETAHGLNPNDGNDRNTTGPDGYTMLEKYVNNLISARYSLGTMVKGGGTVSPVNGSYPANTSVTLTAIPQAGWTFQGWSGDTISPNTSIMVNLNKDKNFIATFVVQTYTVSTTVNGSGTVDISPTASSYSYGSKITITATPSSGYQFSGWSGDTTGTNNPVTITVTKDKTITASFAVISTDVSQLTQSDIKFGCRPNPVKGLAVISFSLPQSTMVTICVCNTMGIEVSRKIKRNGKEGLNDIPIDMSGLTSGIYFCKLSIGSQQFIERIVVLNQ